MQHFELVERLRMAKFNYEEYLKMGNKMTPELTKKLEQTNRQINDLIKSFDLTGDGLLSPEEFFNIIMYVYS